MSNVQIRIATPNDFEAVVATDHVAAKESARIESIHNWIENHQCYLAEANGKILGYGVLNYEFFHLGNLAMLMVDASARKQGIGGVLLRHIETQCKTEKFWVTTNLCNQPMQQLLKSENFVLSGFIENLDPGDPELVFFKRLSR